MPVVPPCFQRRACGVARRGAPAGPAERVRAVRAQGLRANARRGKGCRESVYGPRPTNGTKAAGSFCPPCVIRKHQLPDLEAPTCAPPRLSRRSLKKSGRSGESPPQTEHGTPLAVSAASRSELRRSDAVDARDVSSEAYLGRESASGFSLPSISTPIPAS